MTLPGGGIGVSICGDGGGITIGVGVGVGVGDDGDGGGGGGGGVTLGEGVDVGGRRATELPEPETQPRIMIINQATSEIISAVPIMCD